MSSNTWTPGALRSRAGALRLRGWRVVEAQSKISTMKLTDTLEEQAALEKLIDEIKPRVPEECRHLGYLLLTPFRYAPYPYDSRFRRAESSEGVFYCAEFVDTAIAEAAFHRLLFFAESPATPWPANPAEHTAFATEIATLLALDLMRPPFVRDRSAWTHLVNYSACLDLADVARSTEIEAIRYESARDPRARANVALLTCRGFAAHDVVDRQTWHLHVGSSGIRAVCENPAVSLPFDRKAFAADPRIAPMQWDRG
ncbi:MAG: RES domain-containing protein [Rhizobiales bacterium]|nr:RES domain-containing protein [Hyphomicrobiales bacterium]